MTYEVTIDEVLPWEGQVIQYPQGGVPGITYFAGDVSEFYPGKPPIHTLLFRHLDGHVIGILNYYEVDYPPYEKAGNVNVFVDPQHRRKGVATALVRQAETRWGIDYRAQRYSAAGAALAAALDQQEVS